MQIWQFSDYLTANFLKFQNWLQGGLFLLVFVGTSQIQCCHPFSDPGNCSHTQPEPDLKRHVRDQLHANIVTKYSAVSSERKPMSCLGKMVFRRNTRLTTATKYRGHVSSLLWYPISVKPGFSTAPVGTGKALGPSSCCPFCAAHCQKAPWLMPAGNRGLVTQTGKMETFTTYKPQFKKINSLD